ncbi:MAG: hypothetical protein UHS54_09285 [Lachnospiraceae bacterium]|nr:hypothetical protein [Lachnospiraceae bacterium]
MYSYSVAQWILFFFAYCFLGWVWECCYVSVKERHWVNRGFLNGPCLPIYGFGTIAILFLTLPVRHNLTAVFFLGMFGATLLEFVTGFAMERIFQIKYWDYSKMPLNIKGYVCVPASLCWGAFSILLIRFLHKPVENLILQVPNSLLVILDILLLAYFVTDIVCSTQEALDLKRMIQLYVAKKPELQKWKLNLEQSKVYLEEQSKQYLEQSKAYLEQSKQYLEQSKEQLESQTKQYLEQTKQQLDQMKERLEQTREQLEETKGQLEHTKRKIQDSGKKRAMRMIRRNPGGIHKKLKVDFEEIKNFLEKI